jgi:hypothetical protein
MTTTVSGSQITFNDNTTQNTSAYGGGFAFRNRIINGGMVIDQRNAGASVTINSSTGAYTLDRWEGRGEASQGVYTMQQSSTAPTGFNKSLLVTVTTADSSLASGDNYYFRQIVEGFNIADLGWGTASAQTVTLSFWVRSSLTGTFGGAITNASTSTRAYGFTYTISSANTWEQKTITITGDTTGTWNTDNSGGMFINFSLGANADRQTTANTWSAISSVIISGATGEGSIIGTNGATFYITGVQLEKGSTATSFDYRPYSAELAMCQRYFQLIKFGTVIAQNTTNLLSNFSLLCQMRSSPSIGKTSGSIAIGDMVSAGYTTTSTPTLSAYDNNDIRVNFALAGFTGLTAYRSYQHEPSSGSPSLITVSAEL